MSYATGLAPAPVTDFRLRRTGRRPPSPDAALEARARQACAALDIDRMLALLDELVSIPSIGPDEEAMQRRMAAEFDALGMEVDLWDLDLAALRQHPSFSEEVHRAGALGVVGRSPGSGAGPTLLLNGHVDVVGVGDAAGWSVAPWRATRRGDRVYGRGVVDMKGGIACALEAARALRDSGVRLGGDLGIATVVGEEDGGTGALGLLQRGHGADGAVIMEPTELAIAPAHAGALGFRIHLRGQAAHACVREEGVSAIGLLPPLLEALGALEERRNARLRTALFDAQRLPFALSVGRVQGGEWPSSVAESAQIEGRYGIAPGETTAQARAEFEAAVATLASAHEWLRNVPPVVEWWGGRFEPTAIPADHPLVTCAREACVAATGSVPPVRGMPYGADMRLLVNDGGIPTVMFGPGDVRAAHRPDEFVPVGDLLAVARTLVVLALRFCGVER